MSNFAFSYPKSKRHQASLPSNPNREREQQMYDLGEQNGKINERQRIANDIKAVELNPADEKFLLNIVYNIKPEQKTSESNNK